MQKTRFRRGDSYLVMLLVAAASPALAKGLQSADPAKVDGDYAIQGEYTGTINEDEKIGVQVIALGEGKFRAVVHLGGLPGDGWDGGERLEIDGKRVDGKLSFPGDAATPLPTITRWLLQ